MALAGARQAYSGNLDVDALSIGDPAGVADRTRPELLQDFMKTGAKQLKESQQATGLEAQLIAFGTGAKDFSKFLMAALTPTNRLLWKGMSVDSFETNLQAVINEGRVGKKVIGYGGDSAITKPEWIEPAIAELYDKNSPESFISIKVTGANHTWGDNLEMLAKLYMRALV